MTYETFDPNNVYHLLAYIIGALLMGKYHVIGTGASGAKWAGLAVARPLLRFVFWGSGELLQRIKA